MPDAPLIPPQNSSSAQPLLVVLLGPTASGKTALSLALASRFGGEIVSCDSVAVYRGMEIGTAKPSPEEQAAVPHHLLDIVPPDEPYTAGDYSRDARAALAAITARGHLPVVSGGTGLYLRALLEGLFAGPRRSDPLRARLRASAERHDRTPIPACAETGSPETGLPGRRAECPPEARSASWLHRLLRRLDPASAARIHPHDQPKLIRALEVAVAMRQPLSAALAAPAARDPLVGYRILRFGLQPERAALYARINERAAAMFARGLVEETRQLLERYQPPPASLDALGYRQAVRVLGGQSTLAEAVAEAQQGHRHYAKRQNTWFRREPSVHWLSGFGDEPGIIAEAAAAVLAARSDRRVPAADDAWPL